MGLVTVKLPDVGEGVAEAELVEWHVRVGDVVCEDAILAAVMTDKATVDIPSPADGTVAWVGGEVGETLAVGSPLIRLEVAGAGGTGEEDGSRAREVAGTGDHPAMPSADIAPDRQECKGGEPEENAGAIASVAQEEPENKPANDRPLRDAGKGEQLFAPGPRPSRPGLGPGPNPGAPSRRAGEKPLASPAVRRRALEAGVDLRRVPGSGPAGRVKQGDLDAYLEGGAGVPSSGRGPGPNTSVTDVRIVGLRRRIAEKMALATGRIAHITYVEEIDCQALEELRAVLNADRRAGRPKLTLLPFLMRALVLAVRDQPVMNALFDDEANVLHQHGGVHVGIAVQTPAGLVVPVVRHAEARDLWGCAAEVARLGEAAKAGTVKREELSGSTVTITSLGSLGGIATTPVINHPEVAILGVNKMEVRPVWDGTRFVPRKRMNLSSSFDHRVIDGWDAAVFVGRIKALIETPATLFIEG